MGRQSIWTGTLAVKARQGQVAVRPPYGPGLLNELLMLKASKPHHVQTELAAPITGARGACTQVLH
jgi:hypothetical protein